MDKKIKAFGIFTKDNELLFTDREACIYIDYNTALKEKGSHNIKSIIIMVAQSGGEK